MNVNNNNNSTNFTINNDTEHRLQTLFSINEAIQNSLIFPDSLNEENDENICDTVVQQLLLKFGYQKMAASYNNIVNTTTVSALKIDRIRNCIRNHLEDIIELYKSYPEMLRRSDVLPLSHGSYSMYSKDKTRNNDSNKSLRLGSSNTSQIRVSTVSKNSSANCSTFIKMQGESSNLENLDLSSRVTTLSAEQRAFAEDFDVQRFKNDLCATALISQIHHKKPEEDDIPVLVSQSKLATQEQENQLLYRTESILNHSKSTDNSELSDDDDKITAIGASILSDDNNEKNRNDEIKQKITHNFNFDKKDEQSYNYLSFDDNNFNRDITPIPIYITTDADNNIVNVGNKGIRIVSFNCPSNNRLSDDNSINSNGFKDEGEDVATPLRRQINSCVSSYFSSPSNSTRENHFATVASSVNSFKSEDSIMKMDVNKYYVQKRSEEDPKLRLGIPKAIMNKIKSRMKITF